MNNYQFDGIECFYTTFTEAQTNKLIQICEKNNYYKSGGSDYHGKAKPNVDIGVGFGNLKVQDEIINDWKEKAL